MTELAVIVPSRGRPGNIEQLIEAFDKTTDPKLTHLVVAIDNDDPTAQEYIDGAYLSGCDLIIGPPSRMCPILNRVALGYLDHPAIGFMGDDHRPRTEGWDHRVVEALTQLRTGIVYGDDLIQGPNLPTAVFMSSSIVATLGYMVPPGLDHLFADNSWLTWGKRLNRLRYLPEIIIEHVHPLAGKAASDEGYERNNSGATWDHDQAAFDEYVKTVLNDDLSKLAALP